jgi:hypothetical protein
MRRPGTVHRGGGVRIALRIEGAGGVLENGQWRIRDAWIDRDGATPERVAEYRLPSDLTMDRIESSFAPPETIGFWDLPAVIEQLEAAGLSGLRHRLYYQSMLSQPVVFATMVTMANVERAWGQAWHVPSAPAVSQRDTVQAFAAAAGTTVQVGSVPNLALTVGGLFNPSLKALKEVLYQFEEPWIIDASLTEQTFGLAATPLSEGAAATVAWWRQRLAADASR